MNYIELDMPLNGKNAEKVYTGSVSNSGFWKKTLHIFSEMFASYCRNFDLIGPEAWGLMQ